MKPISTDLRMRIIEVYEEGQLSYAKVAERFRVSESSVKNFVKRWRETGSIEPKPAANGKIFLVDQAGASVLKGIVDTHTDLSQGELGEQLSEKAGGVVSQSTMSRTLKRLKITRKKSRNGPKSNSERMSKRLDTPSGRPKKRCLQRRSSLSTRWAA